MFTEGDASGVGEGGIMVGVGAATVGACVGDATVVGAGVELGVAYCTQPTTDSARNTSKTATIPFMS